jgi:type IV pilus assembly protein PilY1
MFHTNDMRSDMTGTQTIDTYWLDVLEGSDYKAGSAGNIGRNQFYLAAKYGGFTVPSGYSFATRTTILDPTLWSTNGQTIPIPVLPGSGNGPRPDNYFVANQPDKMVSGLSSAFQKIAATVDAFTTSFSTALPQVSNAGNASFSAKYDPSTWTGELTASELTFDTSGNPTVVTPSKWTFSAKLATQLASAGWNTGRRVVTYDGSRGVPFRATGGTGATHIAAADLAALDTSYTTGDDSSNYLNYLRGDQTNEAGGTGTQAYRKRTKLLGDIVGSKALAVSPPAFPYSDATNPGYSTFKSTWATRRTAVYVGSNDGILHAVNGALATASGTAFEWDANAGNEMWAYIPRALFQGPNGTPNADGLASLGNPSFTHHFMVNSTPVVFDADFSRTADDSGTLPATFASPNWKSVLVGGLGKGGRAYYAIDVTDPVSMAASETAAAGKVLWEFNNATTGVGGALGYTFGQAIMTKTRKYGWVVIVPSGYNNSDGQGYFFFVNPRTGALLEKVTTGTVATGVDAGLANLNAFIVDTTDGTIDAIYAGDLLGNLWRLDVTGTTGSYPAPTKMATLTDASSNPQPVTSRPSIQVHPGTKKRFVLLGTGRLLDDTDITSTQMQTYYAIADGTNGAFKPAADAPAMPYTRVGTGSVLANNSNLLNGVVFNPSTQVGWYTDLGKDAGTGIAWRVISDSTTLSGSVAFAAILPNGLVCSPSGTSQVYGVDYASAQTTLRGLVNGVMAPVASVAKDGTVTELHYISVNGKSVLVAGTNTGDVSQVPTAASAGLTVKRLNWRELQGGD